MPNQETKPYRVPKPGEACQTGKIRAKDLGGRPYRLIDETGFAYIDVTEVDLDEGLVTILIRDGDGKLIPERDQDGVLGAKTKILNIKHKMKLIPEELLSDANKGSD